MVFGSCYAAVRYGFPGKTNRSWGWLGGQYDEDDGLPWEEDEDEEDEGDGVPGVTAAEGDVPAVLTGEVVRLNSREELQALTGEGGTMVFVSSRSCRACKYLKP